MRAMRPRGFGCVVGNTKPPRIELDHIMTFRAAREAAIDFLAPCLRKTARPCFHGRSVADADQTGVRIAVPRGDGSDLYLSRLPKRC